jgi:hypothetical protein
MESHPAHSLLCGAAWIVCFAVTAHKRQQLLCSQTSLLGSPALIPVRVNCCATAACMCPSTGPSPAVAATPVPTWQQLFKQEDIGSARVSTPTLVEGSISTAQAAEAAGSVVFAPPAPLMHPVTYIRLALKEAQQLQQQSAGSCSYKVVLHS